MVHDFQAVTLRSNHGGRLAVLQTECVVSPSFSPDGAVPPKHCNFKAIWDTGATQSAITQQVVDACGLKPIGMTMVHAVNSTSSSEVYLVNIGLQSGVNFVDLRVAKAAIMGTDVLIGMDIITLGDFVITNKNGNTVFSFRTPSRSEIDYVQQHNEAAKQERSKHFRRGRPAERKKRKR